MSFLMDQPHLVMPWEKKDSVVQDSGMTAQQTEYAVRAPTEKDIQ